MTTALDVIKMLRPDGGWVLSGEEYSGITFINCEPFSEEEFEKGFLEFENWKSEQEAKIQTKRQAALDKLAALGLNQDDLKALGF
jgi:hypothetical protein